MNKSTSERHATVMPGGPLKIGIDACNIRRGGGLTHVRELLASAYPEAAGIGEVLVWSRSEVLEQLPDRPWLQKRTMPELEGGLVKRLYWQQRHLPSQLRLENCDALFAPGGLLPRRPRVPAVTMSQNMLPFEPREAARFGVATPLWVKMQMLRVGQARSMRQANGVIFLSSYALRTVTQALGELTAQTRVIPHGLAGRFFQPPRAAAERSEITSGRPYRLLYVSTVDMYKHQWTVVEAVGKLSQMGFPVKLDLVGTFVPAALRKLDAAIEAVDPTRDIVSYEGGVPFDELHEKYLEADAFVFASSCENLPNILLEAMAAGLPIACSNMGPMPEVLGSAGVYFDPLSSQSVAEAVRSLICNPGHSQQLAARAHEQAKHYSWTRCAANTFQFLWEVASKNRIRVAREGEGSS